MLCALAAVRCFGFGQRSCRHSPSVQEWPLLCGVLVLSGGFMSVMIGMLYKIVPFWSGCTCRTWAAGG
jgi:hypothetical protein